MKYRSSEGLYRPRRRELDEEERPQPIRNSPYSSWRFVRRWVVAIKSFICMSVSKGQQQTYHAMHFLLATEGKTFERSLSAFRATPAGRDLLQLRPNIRALFSNRAMLEACPPDSLGRWYVEFIRIHGLDEEYYLGTALEIATEFADDAGRVWFHTRVDCSHDMRHVLSGYGPDFLGEICLLSFRFGQIRHAGISCLHCSGF